MSKLLKIAAMCMTMTAASVSSNANALTVTSFSPPYPVLGWAEASQSFTAPSIDNVLSRWSFGLQGSGTNYKFSIVEMSGGAPDVTKPLFSVTNPWSLGEQVIDGINLALTPGEQYAAVIDFLGYDDVSIYFGYDDYADGNSFFGEVSGANSWTSFPEYDLGFSATFVSPAVVPEPLPIAMIGLGFAGIVFARRKKI